MGFIRAHYDIETGKWSKDKPVNNQLQDAHNQNLNNQLDTVELKPVAETNVSRETSDTQKDGSD